MSGDTWQTVPMDGSKRAEQAFRTTELETLAVEPERSGGRKTVVTIITILQKKETEAWKGQISLAVSVA